jgi:hypothetical protein
MDTKEHTTHTAPRRPSSWTAAIAQLPGYPEEAKPKLPPVAEGKARAVSSGMSDDSDAERSRDT